MTSSYIARGGMVGTNNPKDKELQRQFWSSEFSEQSPRNENKWADQLMGNLEAQDWFKSHDHLSPIAKIGSEQEAHLEAA